MPLSVCPPHRVAEGAPGWGLRCILSHHEAESSRQGAAPAGGSGAEAAPGLPAPVVTVETLGIPRLEDVSLPARLCLRTPCVSVCVFGDTHHWI